MIPNEEHINEKWPWWWKIFREGDGMVQKVIHMNAKTKTIRLGSLGLMECFKFPGQETIYRTITYAPSTSPTKGTRWCLDLMTNTAKWFFCREKVFKVQSAM